MAFMAYNEWVGHLSLNGWEIYGLMGGAFMGKWVGHL